MGLRLQGGLYSKWATVTSMKVASAWLEDGGLEWGELDGGGDVRW